MSVPMRYTSSVPCRLLLLLNPIRRVSVDRLLPELVHLRTYMASSLAREQDGSNTDLIHTQRLHVVCGTLWYFLAYGILMGLRAHFTQAIQTRK